MTFPTESAPQVAEVLPQTLQDLLRLYAPQATLLVQLPGQALLIAPEGRIRKVGCDLTPPEKWLDSGVMDWLTHEGQLLGLLWSPEGLDARTVQILTLMLAALPQGGATVEMHTVMSQFPLPTAWVDLELNVLEVSGSFLAVCGLSRAEVVGRSIEEVFGRGDLLAGLQAAASGRSAALEDHYQLRSGAPLWLRSQVGTFYTSQQSGLLWTLQDVTEEHQAHQRLRTLLSGLGGAVAVLDTQGNIQQSNEALGELVHAEQDVAGRRLQDLEFLSREGRKTAEGLIALAAHGGAARANVRLQNGDELALELRRSASDPELLILQASDQAAGRASQPAQPQALSLLQEVLDQQNIATLLIDRQGHLLLINDQAARLAGADAARLLGKHFLRQMDLLDVRVLDTDEQPLNLVRFRPPLPHTQEILLDSPTLGRRPMELTVHELHETPGDASHGTQPDSAGNRLIQLRDLSELKRAQAQLSYGAFHDNLTGLLNRAGLRRSLGQAAERGDTGTVAVAEIDEFAALNIAAEPTAIHHLLMQMAASLRNYTHAQGGEAARLTDGAFAVWLPSSSVELVQLGLQRALGRSFRLGSEQAELTFALGLAPAEAGRMEMALSNAEIAAQHARRQGRGQATVYRDELRQQLADTFRLEQSLRDSVNTGRLSLHYQPAQDLGSGQLVAAEALLRWHRPQGEISPLELLELAGRTHILQALSEWVMREALRQQRSWSEVQPGFRVGVNLSLEELRQPATLQTLLPLFQEAGPSGLVNIEINAASILDYRQPDIGALEQLRAAGAALWLDHFGEGAMSLSSLTEFPLTGLKLHPQLIAGIISDPRRADLVAGTVGLAHSLGLAVTAVGVETPEQLSKLRELGCDMAQGYAIAKPQEAAALSALLAPAPADDD